MDKAQTIHSFWSSFGIAAFDETTVPKEGSMPRLTYSLATSDLNRPVQLTASLWYRSTSWAAISQKADEIADYIGEGLIYPVDGGYLWIVRGAPFVQRMVDEDDSIRRIHLIIEVEFITLT